MHMGVFYYWFFYSANAGRPVLQFRLSTAFPYYKSVVLLELNCGIGIVITGYQQCLVKWAQVLHTYLVP